MVIFAVKGFWALWDNNIYVCCYNRYHGNDVKGFLALLDNIYDYACLPQTFPDTLDGKFYSGIIN
jgi:hypothetical protein